MLGILSTCLCRRKVFVCKINIVGLLEHKIWNANAGLFLVADFAFSFRSVPLLLSNGATGDGTNGRLVKGVCAWRLHPSPFLCKKLQTVLISRPSPSFPLHIYINTSKHTLSPQGSTCFVLHLIHRDVEIEGDMLDQIEWAVSHFCIFTFILQGDPRSTPSQSLEKLLLPSSVSVCFWKWGTPFLKSVLY